MTAQIVGVCETCRFAHKTPNPNPYVTGPLTFTMREDACPKCSAVQVGVRTVDNPRCLSFLYFDGVPVMRALELALERCAAICVNPLALEATKEF